MRSVLAAAVSGAVVFSGVSASADPDLQWWDSTGVVSNGVIDNGSGFWNLLPGNTNWVDFDGTGNRVYNNTGTILGDTTGSDVFFGQGTGGAAGTVTLNAGTTINVNTLNFDDRPNYVIAGATSSDKLKLNSITPNVFANVDATISVTLTGTVGLGKYGIGTLSLTGTNEFAGGILVEEGTLAASSDAAFGAVSNQIVLNDVLAATSGAGLRGIATFSTGRTIRLEAVNNAVEASAGNVMTLTSPFTFSAASNTLTKNNNGVVEITASNAAMTGAITVSGGGLRLSNNLAAGTGAIAVSPGAASAGAALQLANNVTISNPLNLQGVNNVSFGGINFGGQLQSVSGTNTYSGQITQNFDAAIGADAGSTLNITGGIVNSTATTRTLFFTGGGNVNISGTALAGAAGGFFSIQKYGSGTLTIQNANTVALSDATGLRVNAGKLALAGAGTFTGSPTIGVVVQSTGTLELDNSTTNQANRLGGRPITIANGTLNLIGSASAASSETFGAPTFNRGYSIVNVTGGAGQTTSLTFTAAANNPATSQNSGTAPSGASVLFRAVPGAGGSAAINSTAGGFTFVGQTGGIGTNNKGILPWALFDNTAGGTGLSFATADASVGVLRALNPTTEMATNAATANANLNLTAAGPLVVGATAGFNANSITFSGGANLTIGNPGTLQTLTSSSGGILVRDGSSTISGGVMAQTSGAVPFNVWTLGNLTISSLLNGGNGTASGNIGFVKAGVGTLTLSTPQSAIAGLATGVNSMSGQLVVNAGTLVLNGGKNTIQANNFLSVMVNGTVDLGGNSQQVRGLFSDGNITGTVATPTGGTITSSVGTGNLVINQDNNARGWAGTISGSVNVTRSGESTLSIHTPQTYTGATLLNGNTTLLRDFGAITSSSAVAVQYATLTLDNGANPGTAGNPINSTTNIADRIGDPIPITLRGGTFNYIGRAQTNSTETIGNVTFADGLNQMLNAVGGTGFNSAVLSAGNLFRAAGSTGVVRFQGSNGQLGNTPRLTFATINGVSTATAGGGLTNNIIGAWAIQDREWASHIPTLGIGQLNAAGFPGYATTTANTAAVTDNIRYNTNGTANPALLTANRTMNTFAGNFSATSTLDLGGFTLTARGGGVIISQSGDNTTTLVQNGSITSGLAGTGGDLFLYPLTYGGTARRIFLDANIVNNGTGAVRLIRSGDSSTFFTIRSTGNNYTGGTVLNGSTTYLDAASGTPIPTGLVPANGLILNGATLTLVNRATQIGAGNVVTLNGNSVVNLYGNNTLAGLVFNNSGGGVTNPTVQSFSIGASTTTTGGSAAPGGATGVLTVGSSGITATSSNVTSTNIVVGRVDFGTAPNTVNVDTINANGVNDIAPLQAALALQSVIGTTGGINKTGAGVLQFNAQSIYTGPTNVNSGGVRIGVTNGGSRLSLLTLGSGTRLDLANASTTWGSLTGSGTVFSNTGTPTLTVGFDNTSTSFAGQFSRFNDATPNGVGLTKIGTGTLTITSAQSPVNGSSGTVTVNGGGLTYSGDGAPFPSLATTVAAGSAVTFNVNTAGTLTLASTATTTTNRLGLSTAGTFNLQGGTLVLNGVASANTVETISTLGVQNGGGLINLAPAAGSQLNLVVGTLAAVNSTGSGVIQKLANTTPANGNATLAVTTPNLPGSQGTGVAGSTSIAIRPDILADALANGSGTGFLAREGATNFYRPLASSELNKTPATWATIENAGIESSSQTIATNTVANSLTSLGSATLGAPAATATAFGRFGPNATPLQLQLNAGGLLAVDASTLTLNVGSVNAPAGNALHVHAVGSAAVNVNAYLGIGNTGGMVKSDAGTLTLNNRAFYTGNTSVNGGTLNLSSGVDNTIAVVPGATTPSVSALSINGAAALVDLKNNSQTFGLIQNVNPIAGNAGTITNSGGSIVTLTSATGAGSTFAGQINGNLAFTRSGNSTTTLTGANGYVGATTVRGGTLQLRDSGSIASSPSIALHFGTLNVDNSGLTPSANLNPTRLASNVPIILHGGALTLTGGGSIDTTLSVGTVTVGTGGSTVTVTPQANQGSTAAITIGNLSRTANQSLVNFVGSNGTLGGQGLSLNGRIILTQLNGSGFSSANLVDSLIGGWAIANGSSFATYVDGFGVMEMGSTIAGIAAPAYSGTDFSAATTASSNINDGTSRTLTAGAKSVNSLRMAPGGGQTITLPAATAITFGTGIVTNANQTINVTGTDATSTVSGSGTDLTVFVSQGTTNLNAKVTGTAALVKGGGATLALAPVGAGASNTYTGGTFVQGGTLNLNGAAGIVTVPAAANPANGLVVNNASVTMNANPGQIAATNAITINGGGSVTLANYASATSQTLASLNFDNQGGTANPTFTFGTPTALSTLVLTSANAITANNDSLASTPLITTAAATLSELQLSAAAPVITTTTAVGATNSLNIIARITSAGGAISKTGSGSLTLSGASTFNTGFNLDQGSLIFGATSAGTLPTITNGPVGTGTLSIAGGTTLLSDGTVRTVGNAVVVNGDFTVGGVTAGNSVILSGAVGLGATGRTVTVTSPAVTATLSGALTSTASGTALTKAGVGTLVLSSAANSLNGAGVVVSEGVLKNGVANAIPNASLLTVNAGAVYDLNNFGQALQTLAGGGVVTNSGGTAQTLVVGGASAADVATNATSDFGGVLTNAAQSLNLTKSGIGTLTLSGTASSYTGVTNVAAGTLVVSKLADGGLPSSIGQSTGVAANLVLGNGTTLRYTGAGDSTNRAMTIGTGAFLDASGTGAINLSGTAALTLSGTNTARTLTLTGTNKGTNTLAALIGDNGTGATTLAKTGVGTWILNNATNAYTGPTTISAGSLRVQGTSALGATAGGTTVSNGANLQIDGVNIGTESLTLSGNGILSAGALTGTGIAESAGTITLLTSSSIGSSGTDNLTLSGSVIGTGGLTKAGTGTVTLSGATANTFSGLTAVKSGTLDLNKTAGVNAIVGDGVGSKTTPDVLINGGTLRLVGNNQMADTVFVLMTSGTFDINGKTETIFHFTNSGGVYKSPRGSSLTVLDPTWTGGSNDVLGNDTYGATTDPALEISGGINTIHGDESTGQGAGSITLVSSFIFSGAGNPNLTISGDRFTAARLILNSNVTVNPGTNATITSGPALLDQGPPNHTIIVDPNQTGVIPGKIELGSANRTITVGSGGSLGITAVVQSTGGGLTKDGPGTLTLSAANFYAGPTSITAGTLIANGSITSATASAAGTLAGKGTVTGPVSITAGGAIRPGDPGTGAQTAVLTVGSLSMANSTAAVLGVNVNGLVPGSGYDQIALPNSPGSTVTLTGASLAVNLGTLLSGNGSERFYIVNNASSTANTVTGGFASVIVEPNPAFGVTTGANLNSPVASTRLPGGFDFTDANTGFVYTLLYNVDSTTNNLTVGSGNDVLLSIVPEPSALGLAAMAGVGLLRRRRRTSRR
ncbi:autotransporter-associated beta strand repeat-containing protein [Humisphaera borealis]|uniref:Autotransporter-associated beta strand repeat-containing protein n=1 Tax=Humisphaera borealis TaxID=2807512 RepID=A0A7M2WXA6_9BACT|nr:autotransporter-associated beta strand repeat-containing protein [Humisphaera borealis]QOV90168.1 autotransporter-associated beta strand repeat-containing protein [Humisphaera borealis]